MTATASEMRVDTSVDAKVEGITPRDIKTIRLADGDHAVTNCEIVNFAVHNSPADNLFSYLKYKDTETGQLFYSPWRAVQGISPEPSRR